MDLRDTTRGVFLETQRRLELPRIIQQEVTLAEGILKVGPLSYRLDLFQRVIIIAMGKAAVPMAASVAGILERGLASGQELGGVVVGARAPDALDARLRYMPGGHPTPDRHSIAAAEAILELLSTCDEQCLVLLLLSGGASSMVEKPLDPAMDEGDVARFHRTLVHSGLPIGEMNTLRKHFSAMKGGRLAVAAGGATMCTVIVSDVPPGATHVVGSGPSLPDPTTVDDCRRLLKTNQAAFNLDEKLLGYFESPALHETPKADHAAFRNAACHLLLSSDDLCAVAKQVASELGFHVVVDDRCDDWDFRAAAKHLMDHATELRKTHDRVCLVSTGELSVQVQAAPGRGGRNQHFVLECARIMKNTRADITVLSAGSDGIDGNSPAAGAVADGSTAQRAAALGLEIESALASFDSYSFFDALGDVIVTGPSGNNLRDLRVLLAV